MMENTTKFDAALYNSLSSYWISNITILGVLCTASLYILVALMYHQVKVEKSIKQKFKQIPLEKRYRILSRYTCNVCSIASICTHVIGFAVLTLSGNKIIFNLSWQQNTADLVCDVLSRLSIFFFCLNANLFVLFLWLRQRIFYVHPCMKMMNFKFAIKSFSFTILGLSLLSFLSVCFSFLILIRSQFLKNDCVLKVRNLKEFEKLTVAWSSTSILVQISLLFLFVYPIYKLKGQQNNERVVAMRRDAIKAVVLASICFLTDLLSGLGVAIFSESTGNLMVLSGGINLVINQLVSVVCFRHWKQLLWPWNATADRSLKDNDEVSPTTVNELTTNVEIKSSDV